VQRIWFQRSQIDSLILLAVLTGLPLLLAASEEYTHSGLHKREPFRGQHGARTERRFPTSRSTETLVDGFRQKCDAFLAALQDAGAVVSINATLRPPKRAYLMHWSFVINSGEVEPEDVPEQAGVEIEWVHRKPNGSPNLAASPLLRSLPGNSVAVAFFDPQHRGVLNRLKYGNEGARQKERHALPAMTDSYIEQCCRDIARTLQPSGYLFLWVDTFRLCRGDHLQG
jgi:hypothetical protein